MKLAFISTMNDAPFDGSEALWFETAKLALKQKYQQPTYNTSSKFGHELNW